MRQKDEFAKILENEIDNNKNNPERISDNDIEVQNYYQNLRNHIINIYESGDKQEAINLLWEELQQPYIPLAVEKDFFDLYNAYSLVVREESLKIDWNLITKDEIYDRILNKKNGNLDLYFLNLYLNHLFDIENSSVQQELGYQLDKEDFTFIQFLFTHPYLPNMDKYNLMIELKNNQINQDFKYINTNFIHSTQFKNEFIINPKKINLPEENPVIQAVAKTFEDNDAKTPTILNYEMELLFLIYVFFFPRQDIVKTENLIHSISSYVHGIIEGTSYDKKDPIIEIIESELKRIDNLDNKPYAF